MNIEIIGAGMAGLSAAYALAGKGKVRVWEKEALPCTFASSRNAAIFRTYEADPTLSILAKESYRLLTELEKDPQTPELLSRTGLFIHPMEFDYYEESFLKKYPHLEELKSRKESHILPSGETFEGRLIPGNGVIDIHALQEFFIRAGRDQGAEFIFNTAISDFKISSGKIVSFTAKEKQIDVDPESIVINATGSWAASLAQKSGLWAPPLVVHKRHLYYLKSAAPEPAAPVLWDEKRDIYMRPETGGLLATHCDQHKSAPEDFSIREEETENFLKALVGNFPHLKDHYISRQWACLRTFPLDTLPVTGFDPEIKNLFWNAGWGGRGMTISLAMAGTIAELFAQKKEALDPFLNPYSPQRFI